MALRLDSEVVEAVKNIIAEKKIEVLDVTSLPDDIDSGRDKYC
jgi:hypothetical protein